MFWWKHATSPVEDISTPSEGSAPGRRLNENCGTFTPTNGSFCCLSHCSTAEGGLALIIALVARLVKSMSSTLEEKGIEREARTLVSITLSSSAAVWSTCMLRGPVISSFFRDPEDDVLETREGLGLDIGGRQHERRVARVHSTLLNVFRDGKGDDDALIRHSVNVNLLGALHKLGDNDGCIIRHLHREVKEALELAL
mmetsp:Transcript_49473/g.41783  ORF Transcript_49473/g.41783 Transcript_49473/m.41783 type:complete len:198 (-) Transcript_49473:3622-4215(-)